MWNIVGVKVQRPVKIHLKTTAKDHLSLCGKWPDKNWVLLVALDQQSSGTVCQTCIWVAKLDGQFRQLMTASGFKLTDLPIHPMLPVSS